jgi:protein-S-isoprenylcysteine O-methyltransferase Ste14
MTYFELKVPPLILTVVIGVLMMLASDYVPKLNGGLVVRIACSLPFLILALYFCLAGVVEFRKHKTTVDPRCPDKASGLVDTGVYRFSRNPMYVGFALFLVATVVALGAPLLLLGVLLFVIYMNRFQIRPEEQCLFDLFGATYEQYTRKVRRWL